MWLALRTAIVPKKTTAYATQTAAISRSIGHSSSAYSFDWVIPNGSVIAAETITTCHPQNVKLASFGRNRPTCEVRCTTQYEVANSADPPNAKITALVCSGRRRLKVR